MEEWLQFAQALKEGSHRKFKHDCGEGLPRIVRHSPDGWGWSCFRCDGKGFVRRPAESLGEKLARLRRVQAVEQAASFDTSLPIPAEYEPSLWPAAARVWLYRAGISNVEIKRLGFYWCSRLERVVLPVLDDSGECVYWQARTIDKSNIRKYLNPNVDKSNLLARYGAGISIVLTEDILSAYKVSTAGYSGWSLLGTKLSTHVAAQILSRRCPVFVWLDPDDAGRKAAARIIKTLRAYGVAAMNVVSERDPKLLSKGEISSILSELSK